MVTTLNVFLKPQWKNSESYHFQSRVNSSPIYLHTYITLEKEMATHSSTLAWKIPCMEEPGRLHAVHGVAKSWTWLSDFTSLPSLTSYFIAEEGNGNPFQCSCLESPMDRGAWWAMVHGVTESWTRLKWLSMHARISLADQGPLCTFGQVVYCTSVPGIVDIFYNLQRKSALVGLEAAVLNPHGSFFLYLGRT